jgi:hypothetical protein
MIRNILSSFLLTSIAVIVFGSAIEFSQSYDDANRPKPGQRSFVIVFDTTITMHNELEQVREEVETMVEFAANQQVNPFYNFIFVDFNDPGR